MLDETEVESIPGARHDHHETPPAKIDPPKQQVSKATPAQITEAHNQITRLNRTEEAAARWASDGMETQFANLSETEIATLITRLSKVPTPAKKAEPPADTLATPADTLATPAELDSIDAHIVALEPYGWDMRHGQDFVVNLTGKDGSDAKPFTSADVVKVNAALAAKLAEFRAADGVQ
jgi:hypothetical protein